MESLLEPQKLLFFIVLGLFFKWIYNLYKHFTFFQRQGIPADPYISLGWTRMPFFQYNAEMNQRFKYSKIYGRYMGLSKKLLILNDARMARDLSSKELHKFAIRKGQFNFGSTNVTKSLFFMEANEDWKRIRSIVTPAFTSGKLKQMISPIERITNNFIDHLRPMAVSGELFDVRKCISGYVMDAIACCAYGIEVDSVTRPDHPIVVNAKKILQVDTTLSKVICFIAPTIASWLGLEFFNKDAINYFDKLTFDIVEKRLQTKEKQNPDLLGLMMEETQNELLINGDASSKSLKGITKDEMSAQGIFFFIAGFDTTHATFDHAIYYLTQYPEWQEKLYQELDAARDELNYETFQHLPILNALIHETLRLNPPLTLVNRQAKEDCELLDTGIKIPKNTLIVIQPYVIHRDPEYFSDPLAFKPERFLDKEQSVESHFAYMPFGVGFRFCVGKRFALNELRIGLAKLILNYKVTAEPNLKLEYFNGSPLMSPKKLMVKISERQK